MIWIRRIGGALLVVATVVVWFAMAPDSSAPESHTSDLEEILDNADANNALADGAPQQEVVNGWAARDLLALTVKQNDHLSEQARRDERPAALLGLGVLGIALLALTTPRNPAVASATDPLAPSSVPADQLG